MEIMQTSIRHLRLLVTCYAGIVRRLCHIVHNLLFALRAAHSSLVSLSLLACRQWLILFLYTHAWKELLSIFTRTILYRVSTRLLQ